MSNSALVVHVKEFQAVLQPLIDELDAQREDWIAGGHSNKWRKHKNPTGYIERFGGRTYIAQEVGVTDTSVREMMRRTDGFVDLRTADRWLTALGLQHKMQILNFVPNPEWSQERWMRWSKKNGHC
jgi:hypothetical protein